MNSEDNELHPEDRLSRLVAVGAVVATLLAALVAYLLVEASTDANEAGLEADKRGIRAMGELTRAMSRTEADYQIFVLAEELRTKAGLARQETMIDPAERHELASDRWSRLAKDSLGALTTGEADLFEGVYSPERDATFPEHFLATQTQKAVKHAAMQDAYNEKAGRYGDKVSKYVAIITMFGVALYLFALLSVSIQVDIRRLFALVGAALLVSASSWTAWVGLAKVPEVEPMAAKEFAAGHVKLATAHDRVAYQEAIEHYKDAIEQRRTFARAHFELATAVLLKASPQGRGTSVLSPDEATETATSRTALKQAAEHLEQAHDYGLSTGPVLGRLGFYTFLRGLAAKNPDPRQAWSTQGMEYTRQAISVDGLEPLWHFNLGLMLMATGDTGPDLTHYERAMCLTHHEVEPNDLKNHETPTRLSCGELAARGDDRRPAQVAALKAEALSNLELLLAPSPNEALTARANQLMGMVAGSTATNTLDLPRATNAPAPLDVEVSPTGVRFDAVSPAAAERVRMTVVASYRRHQSAPSYVIPELLRERRVNGTATWLPFTSRRKPFSCLPDGTYTVDLYVDGVHVASGEDAADLGHLHQALVAPDLDLRTCVPDHWKHSKASLPSLMYGKESLDETRGAYLFRFGAHPARQESARRFAHEAAQLVLGNAARHAGDEPVRVNSFRSLRRATQRTYTLVGAVAAAAAGIDKDGAGLVVVLKGTKAYLQTPQAKAILDSVARFFPPS
ncbi:MAG: hypothetical protein ACRDOY_00075 [Nocardioidaceae bacterium]